METVPFSLTYQLTLSNEEYTTFSTCCYSEYILPMMIDFFLAEWILKWQETLIPMMNGLWIKSSPMQVLAQMPFSK